MNGEPRSWKHYQYGLAYLGRAHLRDQVAHAEAVRLAGAVTKDWEQWHRDTQAKLAPRLRE